MTVPRRPLLAAVLALVGGLAACGADQPYIRAPELIDRDHEYFVKERTERESFVVCYASWETRPSAVRDLAVAECRRFGKRAVLVEGTLQVCPLVAPAGAEYACLGDGETLADVLPERFKRRWRAPAVGAGRAPAAAAADAPDWAPATAPRP